MARELAPAGLRSGPNSNIRTGHHLPLYKYSVMPRLRNAPISVHLIHNGYRAIMMRYGMNKHIGSNFDDFLAEQGIAEEVSAAALKRVIAWQIAEAMKLQKVTKKALAQRMHTSRTAVDRALDQNDAGMTLATLASAARALGQRVEVRLVPEHEGAHA